MIPDELSALMECEKFCGRNDKCWGCIKDRNGSHQWTAISECEHVDQQEDLGLRKVSQKPRKFLNSILTLFTNVRYLENASYENFRHVLAIFLFSLHGYQN